MGEDDTYVHDPAAFEPDHEDDGSDERTTAANLDADASRGEFGWRGWALVAALFVALVVVPGVLLLLPAARPLIASLGLTYRDAYLVLPLVPAIGLGALSVWSAVAHRRR